jgi:hypothetical protein
LCNIVVDFIAAHEVTHIAHGHVGYRSPNKSGPSVPKLRWQAGTPDGNYESQAMEMDADFTAADLVVRGVKRLVSIKDELPPTYADYFKDSTRAMFNIAAAVCIQSRLFGDSRLEFANLVTDDHPPDRWRQLMVLNAMGHHADEKWGVDESSLIMQEVNRAIEEVELAFERMTGEPRQVYGLHDVWHAAGWDYAKALCNCWNFSLKPKLAPHTFRSLSSYSFDWVAAASLIRAKV